MDVQTRRALLLVGLLTGVPSLAGCATREPPAVTRDYLGGFEPRHTKWPHGSDGREQFLDTEEDVVEMALDMAEEEGWKGPVGGAFIYFGDGGKERRKVVVEPLTLDTLVSSGIRLEEVEWVYVFRSVGLER